jgi:hypothetical protein
VGLSRIQVTGLVDLEDGPEGAESMPMVAKIDNLEDEAFDRSRY